MASGGQRTDFGHFHLVAQMQKSIRMQTAKINPGFVHVHHVNVIIVDGSWPHAGLRVEFVAGPFVVLPCQMEPPDEFFLLQIKSKQAVEAR